MKSQALFSLVILVILASCTKDQGINPSSQMPPSVVYTSRDIITEPGSNVILVDASKDGGVWWYPQSPYTGFSATSYHQGQKLADYLRASGFKVHELPRDIPISDSILSYYTYVIRAGGLGNYTSSELAAYQSFLNRSGSLLLLQDHLGNFPNDQLSITLGAKFEGSITGTLSSFNSHSITTGVLPLSYIAGSVIKDPDPAQITNLAYFTINNGGNTAIASAIGIINHPTCKIVYLGDINGLEQTPQPLTANIINWLFR